MVMKMLTDAVNHNKLKKKIEEESQRAVSEQSSSEALYSDLEENNILEQMNEKDKKA